MSWLKPETKRALVNYQALETHKVIIIVDINFTTIHKMLKSLGFFWTNFTLQVHIFNGKVHDLPKNYQSISDPYF